MAPRTIKLASIRHGCILLVFKGATKRWSLPGGKVNRKQEKSVECLRRELREEIPRLRVRRLRRWRRFNNRFRGRRFTVTVYFGKVSGMLITDREIDAAAWVSQWRRLPLSVNTRRVLERLASNGYL